MAFVVELIPEEAIQGILSDIRFNNVRVTPGYSQWAVDRERNAQIVLTGKVGGSYEGTQETKYYSLYWNGEQIRLAADPLPETFPETGGAEANWRVHDLVIPLGLQNRHDEVRELIRQAFQAVGICFDGQSYKAVNVQFAADLAK